MIQVKIEPACSLLHLRFVSSSLERIAPKGSESEHGIKPASDTVQWSYSMADSIL